MADEPQDITVKVILEHMRGMEDRLTRRIDGVDTKCSVLGQKIEGVETRLTAKIEHAEHRLTAQIDSIDKRLDAIEIEKLPGRIRKVERRLGLAPSRP